MNQLETLITAKIEAYKAGNLEVIKTPSGLEYIIIEQGDNTKPEKGNTIYVHYEIWLRENSKKVDSSIDRGKLFPFKADLGQVIAGLDEAILLLNKGTKALLFIPYNLGYGARGAGFYIPPNADLAYYIDFLGFED